MDIHFCDLCGVRVTDVDLRGGHGIRKRYDVICATCLELGHGKEWLARHQRSKSATATSQPIPSPAVLGKVAAPDPAIITHARDRVETFEDGEPSPAVSPLVIAADDTPSHVDISELNKEDHVFAANSKSEGNHFAAAASSFSALAQPGHVNRSITDDDDDVQQGEGLKDESTAAPILADDQAGFNSSGDSPFGFTNDPKKARAAQKDETLPVDVAPMVAEKAPVKKASSGSSAIKKATAVGKKSNGANSKSTNARSGKGPVRKKNKNKNILMMSALSLGILTMILLITIKAIQGNKKAPERQTLHLDMSEDLKAAIKEAKANASSVLNSKDIKLDAVNAAKAKIFSVRALIDNFEKEAKSQNQTVWDADAFGRYMEVVGWPDTNSLVIPLNQKAAILLAPK